MKQLKNKKTILFVGLSAFILVFVGSLAYNKDLFSFANLFHLGGDVVEFVETFDSPDNWTPCTTTPKTAIATNKNNSPRYVRMKINEYWRTSDTTTPESDHETSDLPLTWDDNGTEKHYAVINTQNDDKWELKSDGWYYYKTTLGQDESTLSLLESVTFNCEVNTAGEVRYSVDGKSSESIPTEYGGAKYHLYITFQMSSESMAPVQHTANCDNPTILYDIIACQSNGTDENINFNERASSNFDSSNGVNTVYAHRNDEFPVHYFRGNPSNNFLEYNGFCWRLIRTAEGGGVKMLYSGVKKSNGCTDTELRISGTSSGYYQPSYTTPAAEGSLIRYEMAHLGYMFGAEQDYYEVSDNMLFGRLFAKDVRWDGEKYTLLDTTRLDGSPYSPTHIHNYSYICLDRYSVNTTECTDVYYFSSVQSGGGGTTGYVMRLTNGVKIDEAIANMKTNTRDSLAKSVVDGWFANNITDNTDALADVVYCNDRESHQTVNIGQMFWLYDGYSRLLGLDNNGIANPSVDCTSKNDSFTVSSENGNGALTHPVALLTLDEMIYGGFCMSTSVANTFVSDTSRCLGQAGTNYLDASNTNAAGSYWTMTPLVVYSNESYLAKGYDDNWVDYDGAGDRTSSYRPVLALKYNTEVEGTGTQADPYRLK